jgi:hypothetical protein
MAEIEFQGKCRGDQTDSDPLARSAKTARELWLLSEELTQTEFPLSPRT